MASMEYGKTAVDKSHLGKELKKQDSMEDVQDEQVPPPPRTAILLLDAYPEKMIQIHEELEAKAQEQERLREEEERRQAEEDKKKTDNMAKSQMANKSSVMSTQQPNAEEEKKKRKDSTDIKHLENDPLHFCYTQNKNVLLIDTNQGVDQIMEMIEGPEVNTHISFWVYFEAIRYDHPKNNITFLTFGPNSANKSLIFSLEKKEVKQKDAGGKDGVKIFNTFIVKYVAYGTNKVNRICAECYIQPNKLYFVTLSSIFKPEGFYEARLTVNAKVEGNQSSNEPMQIHPNLVTVGSEVMSSPFKGLLSDLVILSKTFDLKEQKDFYDKYWDFPNGMRGRELCDDELIHAKVNEKHAISGVPKDLLRDYKYDESFKRTIQENRNKKPVVETEEEIKAKTDKSKAAKLEREKKEKMIKQDVNTFIADIEVSHPEYLDFLRAYVQSRKWIFKSWNLYSPTIKKAGEPKLPFNCIHHKVAKLTELRVPYYGIEEELFYRVLNMVKELTNEHKRILLMFAEVTGTILKDKELGIYICYDHWLHYLCWADRLKPEGWVEKVQEENEEEEEEDMSSSEEDPDAEANKKKEEESKEPQTKFVENFFIGDKGGLKEKIKHNMHELNETAEEETGDIPKMYYENRKLHSFEVTHDHDRVQSVIFNYIVRTDEKVPWEEVMKEYHASGQDPTATAGEDKDTKAGTKDAKVVKPPPGGAAPQGAQFRFEQVRCFQDKLPEEDPKAPKEVPQVGADGKPIEDLSKPKRYKFPDAKLMTKDSFKVIDAEKITFKIVDNKIFSIRAFYPDGRAHRLELNKHMSPEFERKREQRLEEIKAAHGAIAKQNEELARKEKEKKEREQKERRERRENKRSGEAFNNAPPVEEEQLEAPKKIVVPELGEYDKQKMTWVPGKECNFGMALINEDNDLIGFGLYKDHHAAVKMHNPESLEEIPIHNFKDVLKHICKRPVNEHDSFRIRHLKFKYTTEKFLEVAAKVERKDEKDLKWYCDIQDEKAAAKKAQEEEEERRRKEEAERLARSPAGMNPEPQAEPKKEKKGPEERPQEEIDEELKHLFDIDFVHEDIARQRRIEEIAVRKAQKEKMKGDDKGKGKGGAGAPAKKPEDKAGGKDPKKDDKKGGKKDDKNKVEEKKEDVIHTMDIDLKKLLMIRVDHRYGQVCKILFHYDDESVTIIQIPSVSDEKGKAFMAMVNEEKAKRDKEEQKNLDDYRRELRKHERAEKRKRIRARKEGQTYVPTEFNKQKPEPKKETDEEKRIIDQSIFYINNYKHIEGIWAIFNPELKHFKLWGTQFKVKKTEDELKKEKEEELRIKAEKEKAAAHDGEDIDITGANNSALATTTKKEEEAAAARRRQEANEAHRLKDDFIRNYSLSRLGLKLIFFIDYHVTPQKDEKKQTITVNSKKYDDALFKENYDAVSKFVGEILPDSTIVANFRQLGAIGLFRVYTYGFGENPEQEKEFFSNRHIKVAFPDIKKLYYALIDEFVKYDDLKSLENRQKDQLQHLGIQVGTPDAKKTTSA